MIATGEVESKEFLLKIDNLQNQAKEMTQLITGLLRKQSSIHPPKNSKPLPKQINDRH